jgi:uncharacterized protein (DUF2062 family)
MARKFFKKLMPDPDLIRRHKSLQLIAHWLHEPNLWHLNRYSVSTAFFIGLFCAFIPLPAQMLIAATIAVWWRANLPISVALVWITNPLTMPFFFGAAYFAGLTLLQQPLPAHFTPTWEWFEQQAADMWRPFLVGSLACGLISGAASALAVRVLWRVQVALRWKARGRRTQS